MNSLIPILSALELYSCNICLTVASQLLMLLEESLYTSRKIFSSW